MIEVNEVNKVNKVNENKLNKLNWEITVRAEWTAQVRQDSWRDVTGSRR